METHATILLTCPSLACAEPAWRALYLPSADRPSVLLAWVKKRRRPGQGPGPIAPAIVEHGRVLAWRASRVPRFSVSRPRSSMGTGSARLRRLVGMTALSSLKPGRHPLMSAAGRRKSVEPVKRARRGPGRARRWREQRVRVLGLALLGRPGRRRFFTHARSTLGLSAEGR